VFVCDNLSQILKTDKLMQPFILPLRQARFGRRGALACFVFLLIFGQAIVLLAGDTREVARISVQKVQKLLGRPDTVVIDVRTYRNWWRSSKKIPTAVREDPLKVDQWIEKYVKDQTLIFYCS
jgi:Rhodanese-like domain